jgi:hypothetical protein
LIRRRLAADDSGYECKDYKYVGAHECSVSRSGRGCVSGRFLKTAGVLKLVPLVLRQAEMGNRRPAEG